MKLLPFSIGMSPSSVWRAAALRIVAATFVGCCLMLVPARAVLAEDPPGPDSAIDSDSPSQVLEIPQACTRDGVEIGCNAAAAGTADPSAADSTVATAPSNGGDTTGVDEAAADASWGTIQEYQNQFPADGAMVAGVPSWSGSMSSAAYAAVPLYASPPVIMRPAYNPVFPPRTFAPAGPIAINPIMPARPWMAPSVIQPFRPGGPMPGMASSPFRVR